MYRTKSNERNESLDRAINGSSVRNYAEIIRGFSAKGIPEAEIKPRVNVFTFRAWQGLGRCVKKGEHGVKITTFVTMSTGDIDKKTGEPKTFSRPRTCTVFHISQTKEFSGGAK